MKMLVRVAVAILCLYLILRIVSCGIENHGHAVHAHEEHMKDYHKITSSLKVGMTERDLLALHPNFTNGNCVVSADNGMRVTTWVFLEQKIDDGVKQGRVHVSVNCDTGRVFKWEDVQIGSFDP